MTWSFDEQDDRVTLSSVRIGGVEIEKGSRVRLNPWPGADIFDLVLAGKIGIVEAIEQDLDGMVQIAVVLEDDPGADLGMDRQPGHRFFFRAEEIEPLAAAAGEERGEPR